MRKLPIAALASMLGLCLAIAPSAQAKAKITKPSAPTVASISSSAPSKGKVNVTVTITLPSSNGGSKITGSKVTAGGKTCTIKKTRTSCTIKSIKNGKVLSVYATSKNNKGFGPKSTRVTYAAGSIAWTATPSPTCAAGGACLLGDTGPGGGIVFYVDNAGFSCGPDFTTTGSPTGGLCRYLEVAPIDWHPTAGTLASQLTWAVTTNIREDVVDLTNEYSDTPILGIGLGYKNSVAIVNQGNDLTTAAGAARNYTNNAKADWYLPTKDELNLLCQWNHGVPQSITTKCYAGTLNSPNYGANNSGFDRLGVYWTSSELTESSAWTLTFSDFFMDVLQPIIRKDDVGKVRPVRAF